jgi:hypothetical protein
MIYVFDMTCIKRESGLYGPVAAYAHNKGFYRQQSEVQFYEYRIDLYGFSRRLGLTVAIELKMYNWRRAIEQGLIYQLCSDIVYIALPLRTAIRVEMEAFRNHGIGLIGVRETGRCFQLLEAVPSAVTRSHYRDKYIQILEGVGDA